MSQTALISFFQYAGIKNKWHAFKRMGRSPILQKKIDAWHKSGKNSELHKNEYISFLKKIGYIVEEQEDFQITTKINLINTKDNKIFKYQLKKTNFERQKIHY